MVNIMHSNQLNYIVGYPITSSPIVDLKISVFQSWNII